MVNFGVRRLNIGGKIMTNHLKQVVSYRAYNVMDETHLINDIKVYCFPSLTCELANLLTYLLLANLLTY